MAKQKAKALIISFSPFRVSFICQYLIIILYLQQKGNYYGKQVYSRHDT